MPTYGPNYAGSAIDDGGLEEAWTDAFNAAGAPDDLRASATNIQLNTTNPTNALQLREFGFAVPGAETVVGVVVDVERHESVHTAGQMVKDYSIRLWSGTALSPDDNADTLTEWPTADAFNSYGGANDRWGWTAAQLTPAVVNDPGFGLDLVAAITMDSDSAFPEALVDAVRITIYTTVEERRPRRILVQHEPPRELFQHVPLNLRNAFRRARIREDVAAPVERRRRRSVYPLLNPAYGLAPEILVALPRAHRRPRDSDRRPRQRLHFDNHTPPPDLFLL